MDNETLKYLKNLSDEALNSVGLLMYIGGGSTIFFASLILMVVCLVIEFKRDNLIKKFDKYEFNKYLYLENLSNYNEDSFYLNNTKKDKPVFENNITLMFLNKIGLIKFIKNDIYSMLCYLTICGLLFSSLFIGLHNSNVITDYLEENLDESYLSKYINSYEIKSVEVLNNSSNDSYYVILYKNGNTISKYNYYGNLNISNDNKNTVKFYSSKLMKDIDESDLDIGLDLYYILDDKFFHSIEVSEDLIKY